jgi:hypothetical protein
MAGYRLYFFDAQGHIRAARNLDCCNDDSARKAMLDQSNGQVLEVWQKGRLVERYSPQDLGGGPHR